MLREVAIDGGLEVGDGAEHAAPQGVLGERREERLDSVEPGALLWREVVHPAGVAVGPAHDFGRVMRGDIVEHHVNEFPGRDLRLDGVQEAKDFLMPVALHAAAEDGVVEDAEGGKQGCRAMRFVVVSRGAAVAGLKRQARLDSVKRLDLVLLVDGQHDRMRRRGHVEADDIAQLAGERGVLRALEGARAMRLQRMRLPDSLDRRERNADGRGHRPAGPVSGLAGRLGAGKRHNPLPGLRRQRLRAGRGLSHSSPSIPTSAKRRCRRHTVVRPTPKVIPMSSTGTGPPTTGQYEPAPRASADGSGRR